MRSTELKEGLTAYTMADLIGNAVSASCDDGPELHEIENVTSAAMVGPTFDGVFQIIMQDGSVFRVTVTRTRRQHVETLPVDGTLEV